ncbi:MAG: leucine--tRNA ligase [Myxococcales bacterium]|nr:MAG: leucine--tRNA ligase [Myxococcales bacterium]
MSRPYNADEIESKWRRIWEERGDYVIDLANAPNPFYNLMMFPYPSAEGLHVGNCFAFIGSDIYGRYMKQKGHTVFEPMGFDAFGIHSENFALKVGKHPAKLTRENVANFRENQLKKLGAMFDWTHSVDTTEPDYYKWTQWIFLQLYKHGLAERRTAPVNWCPACKTVLADSQVENGFCERHADVKVEQRELAQWFFKITAYAERLLKNLEVIDWPEIVTSVQRDKIGKSIGAMVTFHLENGESFEIFTTRPDTLWGVTYMVFSPEHPMVEKIATAAQRGAVKAYQEEARRKSSFERAELSKEKSGVFTGGYAINPVNGERVPIFIADYVLMGYGTGAIMAVPAHDQRDYEFAKLMKLEIREVIAPDGAPQGDLGEAYAGPGQMVNSGPFTGTPDGEGVEKVCGWLEEKKLGRRSINYRLRDWCVSRQRYWGPPIPMIHCDACGIVPVPESQLPVLLPESDDYIPDGSGKSPLARNAAWVNTTCPACGKPARRETDVSDNFLDSAWYYLRYPSTNQHKRVVDEAITKKWLPVDMYIGGKEHSFGHLLYFRFITMALHDFGYLHFEEPTKSFRAHGLITKSGQKMSKSKGNVVNPDEFIGRYGADTFRLYLMFLGPYTLGGDWDDQGIVGCRRFVERVWDWVNQGVNDVRPEACVRLMHRTIKKVTDDIPTLSYNTAIAQLMTYINELRSAGARDRELLETLVVLLSPFAPFAAEELWRTLGHTDANDSVFKAGWPGYDPEKLVDETTTIILQVNGKLRGELLVPLNTPGPDLERMALAHEKVLKHITGEVRKVIVVPNKLVNVVAK